MSGAPIASRASLRRFPRRPSATGGLEDRDLRLAAAVAVVGRLINFQFRGVAGWLVDREDMLQTGLEAVVRTADRWDAGRYAWETYVFLRARGAIRDEVRKQLVRRHCSIDGFDYPDLADEYARLADRDEAHWWIATFGGDLTERERRILSAVARCPTQCDAARAVGCSESTVTRTLAAVGSRWAQSARAGQHVL